MGRLEAGPGAGLLAMLALTLSAGGAQASLSYCNAGTGHIRLALALTGSATTSANGWITLAPGSCFVEEYGELQDRHFILTDEPGFRGSGNRFCLGKGETFYLEDATGDCAARGLESGDFRETTYDDPNAKLLVNLDGHGGTLPPPDLPMIDLSHPFTPARAPGPGPAPGPAPGAEGDTVYAIDLPPGQGDLFTLDGVWQGCDEDEGVYVCTFHAEGWKFYVYADHPNPESWLRQLAAVPVASAITATGEVLTEGDISAGVSLTKLVVHAENPFGGLFAAIAGAWKSEADPAYEMEIEGSEITEYYNGEPTGARFLRLMVGCPDTGGDGPAIVTTTVPGFETTCFRFDALGDTRMDLIQDGTKDVIGFVRP